MRHSATTTPSGITVGAGDPPLSEGGRAEARRVSEALAGRRLVAVWSSDLKRAVETASLIAAPHHLPVATTRALRELDFGAWEGRDLRDLWIEDLPAARAWEANITDTPRAFAETVHDLEVRVRTFWRSVVLAGEIAVVAHRGSLAALQSLLTGDAFEECFRSPAAWVEVTPRSPTRSATRSRLRRAGARR